jgi:hypothetical protein
MWFNPPFLWKCRQWFKDFTKNGTKWTPFYKNRSVCWLQKHLPLCTFLGIFCAKIFTKLSLFFIIKRTFDHFLQNSRCNFYEKKLHICIDVYHHVYTINILLTHSVFLEKWRYIVFYYYYCYYFPLCTFLGIFCAKILTKLSLFFIIKRTFDHFLQNSRCNFYEKKLL